MSSPFSIAASSLSFAVLLIASPAAAQTKAAEPNPALPAAQEGAPAAAEGDEEEGYVPEDEGAVEEESAAEEAPAPSAASLNANRRVSDPHQSLRIVTEVVIGYLGSGIGTLAGMAIASAISFPLGYPSQQIALYTGAIAGGGLSLGISVWLTGLMLQGKGQFGPTLIGALIGTGIDLGLVLAAAFVALANPALYVFVPIAQLMGGLAPLIGAVVGYETSHTRALRNAVTVAPLPVQGRGGGVVLAWSI